MNSDLRASLLELGFNLSQARAAVAAGNTSVEAATEWIFEHNETINSQTTPPQPSNNTLRLRTQEEDAYDADLQRALAESTKSAPTSPPAVLTTTTTTTHHQQQEHQLPADDTSNTQQIESSPKKIKINIVKATATTPIARSVIAPLPLTSRHNEQEAEAQNATRLSEANKRAEKAKREKMEARIARQRALDALKEDRENRKVRKQVADPVSYTGSSSGPPPESASTLQEPAAVTGNPPAPLHTPATAPSNAMVQLRMKNGSVLKRSFQSTATIKDLFDLARSEDRNIGNADISLIQPFPRREFTVGDSDLTLSEASLCPSCSLNVLVQTPILAPQPVTPTPGAWIPSGAESQGPTPMDIDADEGTFSFLPHLGNNGLNDNVLGNDSDEESQHDDEQGNHNNEDDDEENSDDDDDEEEEEDQDMHALPVHDHINPNHPFAIPGLGRGRGRGRGGHGRGGMSFSGAGHSLGSGGPVVTPIESSSSQPEMTPEERAQQRRQRILEAMESRTKAQEAEKVAQALTVGAKRVKEREIPSLQSLCCYQVAVMLTAKDSKSSANLKLWGENVGSQVGEAVIQELIRLKQLDQLTFKRFYTCPIVNMVLDAYSRATDSLMEVIGGSQARSLTYLSLKECTFLTDTGFKNISRFEFLEFLDLSHCRITNKTLEFTLNLPYLSTLNLSATKVTTAGLAKVIADAEWKSTLQTLDLSYCQGVAGPFVLYNLQGLERLRTLKLNSSKAFDSSPVKVPDNPVAFKQLVHLDLASTAIDASDMIALLPVIGTVEKLNLTSCDKVARALEEIVQNLSLLQDLKFPSRNQDLMTVLPIAAELPLTHLDLSDFKFIGDEAILSLEKAKNLQMLSLSGTMLTDVGSAVLVHMSSLKELSLDRTRIGDKSMEYLRDLGRIEILSLSQVERLTTVGVGHLGRSAFFSLKLKRLNLRNNPFIHDEALAVFAHCNSLNTLILDHTDVTEFAAHRLQDSLPNLTQLRINEVTNGEVYKQNPRALLTLV